MVAWSGQYLEDKGVPRGRLDAEHLLASVFGIKRLELYLRFDQPMDARERAAYKPLLLRRGAREPLQYVLGSAPFRTLELAVDRRVAIPRPETEQLVEELVEVAGWDVPFESALDLGTGSGAIAISLAAEGLAERVTATDASEGALAVARLNAAACGQPGIRFRQGDGAQAVAGATFDVVLSNPPYLTEEQWAGAAPEVRDWEPRRAMVAGADGLAVMKSFADGLRRCLMPGGWAGFEIGDGQAEAASRVLRAAVSPEDGRLHVRRDLSGRPRYVFARRDGAPRAVRRRGDVPRARPPAPQAETTEQE